MTTHSSLLGCLVTVSLLLTGCFSGDMGQSSLIPQNSVVVTTTPSIAIAPCETLSIERFTAPDTFISNGKTFTLIGVTAEEIDDAQQQEDLYAFLKQKGFCIKRDPSITEESNVYLFTSENGLINGEVIRRGLATTNRTAQYIYKEYLINLEKEAQTNLVGIWKDPERLASAQEKAKETTIAEDSSAYLLIFPQDAAQHNGDTVTLRMTVRSIGKSTGAIYFNSEEDYTSEANVPVILSLPTSTEGRALEMQADELLNKTIDATGRITVTSGRAQMLVTRDADVVVTE